MENRPLMVRWLPRMVVRLSVGLAVVVGFVAGCGASAGRVPAAMPRAAVQGAPTAARPAGASDSLQKLYEAGRYQEVLDSLGASPGPEALWFAAQSNVQLGAGPEAVRQFTELGPAGATPAWHTVSELA